MQEVGLHADKVGVVRALRAYLFTSTYHQRTELIMLSYVSTVSLTLLLYYVLY